ncbi:hypothetical protein Ancab_035877 [Ancistrocladus abbreviatus]
MPAAAAVAAGQCIARLLDPASSKCFTYLSSSGSNQHSIYFPHQKYKLSALSMNGCQGDSTLPVETIETRTLPSTATLALAMDRLNGSVYKLKFDSPPSSSGIIRIQVPIEQGMEAIEWLHAQNPILPRFFFSGRRKAHSSDIFIDYTNGNGNGNGSWCNSVGNHLVSVAGIGAAVYFRHFRPFAFDDWKSIKRFLSKSCPLIRAYGAIRFDARADISSEWEAFGSFYFMVPQVEFDELDGSSVLASYVAWDDALSWTWRKAIDSLQATLEQVSFCVVKLKKEVPKTSTLGNILHTPSEEQWHAAVNKALQIIRRKASPLTKVVLARSSRMYTANAIDPLAWLACLQGEGENSYQFCLQPPDAPAFIGNTPEQLFHRNQLNISSEALAGTRARCRSSALEL